MPVCVIELSYTSTRFRKASDLQTKYGTNTQLEGMPDPSVVKPSIMFKPRVPKKQLVPYDSAEAISLFANRPAGLTPNYSTATDVTDIPAGLIRRNKLH